ncbi:hypothetical protein EDB92DRAFT_1950658 [Lactarius akahatsu]|uniref:Uncharacterized protein n=1 Tax=Lactarius akahatsu TaxID=416441 RepID=A0AAD4LAG0_9AGAM|nr:hypothetical protein EDB92DRAFT_1950658 [Lactarius akahatsu]
MYAPVPSSYDARPPKEEVTGPVAPHPDTLTLGNSWLENMTCLPPRSTTLGPCPKPTLSSALRIGSIGERCRTINYSPKALDGQSRAALLSREGYSTSLPYVRLTFSLRWVRNTLEFAGYSGEYPDPQDPEIFMEEFRIDGEDATFTVVQVGGGYYVPSKPGLEGNLDSHLARDVSVLSTSGNFIVGTESVSRFSTLAPNEVL